jgi:hypothetical protein
MDGKELYETPPGVMRVYFFKYYSSDLRLFPRLKCQQVELLKNIELIRSEENNNC